MALWVEILVTAFFLQLLALPGEKGQLVIGALATAHNPYVVVAGAATAFGGWTALEILLGEALKGALPAVYLDAITAGLFVVFAFWMLYSEQTMEFDDGNAAANGGADGSASAANGGAETPATAANADSGLFALGAPDDSEVPATNVGGYVASFSAMAFAEFGDKTQLITISLAAQYGAHPSIWAGEMLAIIPVSLATALFFSRAAHYLNLRWLLRGAAVLFLLFAADITAKYVLGFSVLPL
jgi:putative Ca2+/H+ antiporter (TMEM165/GDT1 family)